jgi:hypothetical protein
MVLALSVEGVSMTEQAEVVEVAGEGAHVVEENVSEATLDEKVTRPEGLDAVPAPCTSATVTVTVVGERTVAGLGAKVKAVEVTRAATVIVMVCVEVWGVGLPSVAVTENENVPAAKGVPERSPAGESVSPVGRVPRDVQVIVPEPPADWNAKL